MSDTLSTGAIERMASFPNSTHLDEPVLLQIVSRIQQLPGSNPGAPARYRCIVSDGKHSCIAVLSGLVVQLIENETISRHSVIKVTKANVTRKQNNNENTMLFLIVVDAQFITTLPDKVGNPQGISVSNAQQGGDQSNVAAGGGGASPHAENTAAPAQQPQKPSFGGSFQQQQQQQKSFGATASSNFMSRNNPGPPGAPGFSANPQVPVHSGPAPALHPISGLNPYHNRWTIRARVSQKSAIKTWNKPTSQGKLFSANLLDESGEIRATVFTHQVDHFYPMLEVGKVYYISDARVTMAKKNFSNVKHEYELVFENNTKVELCLEQGGEVPQMHYDFIPLGNLLKFEKGQVVDVLGVVRQVADVAEIASRNNPESKMTKRDITLVDKSGFQVRTTLWGQDAIGFSADNEPVVAFKGVRVGDYGGRNLSLPNSGSFTVNPDIPEAHALRGWYDAEGRNVDYQSHGTVGGAGGMGGEDRADRFESQLKTMAQIRDENIGMGDSTQYFNVKGTIMFIRNSNFAYPACPTQDCNKKVVEDQTTGQWRCERCERSFAAPDYRYIFSANVSDETGQNWLQCFNEIGQQIIGCSANEMVELQQNNQAVFDKKIKDATFKQYKFRCRAKSETFNETTKVRINIVNIYPIDFVAESQRLSKLIESYA